MREDFSNVARYLSVMAREEPHLCAIKDPHHRESNGTIIYNELTFLELNEYCDAVSRYISECKIGRGTRVLLLLNPGLKFLFIMGIIQISFKAQITYISKAGYL